MVASNPTLLVATVSHVLFLSTMPERIGTGRISTGLVSSAYRDQLEVVVEVDALLVAGFSIGCPELQVVEREQMPGKPLLREAPGHGDAREKSPAMTGREARAGIPSQVRIQHVLVLEHVAQAGKSRPERPVPAGFVIGHGSRRSESQSPHALVEKVASARVEPVHVAVF